VFDNVIDALGRDPELKGIKKLVTDGEWWSLQGSRS
jgi:hypothetical protein